MLSFLVCLLTAAPDPQPTRPPTLDDYFSLVVPIEIALSPDGQSLAFVQSAWAADRDGRVNTLRVMEIATGKVRLLLDGKPAPRSLHWTKDGKAIQFLANKEKRGSQIWQMPASGGEAKPLTDLEGGIRAYDHTPDGTALYALADIPLVDPTFAELRKEFAKLEYGTAGKKVSHLWRIEPQTGKAEKIVAGNFYLHEFAPSPDGKRIALITAPDDTVASFEGRSKVEIFDLTTRKVTPVPEATYREKMASKFAWIEKLAWSPSGRRLAFGLIFDAFPCEILLVEGFAGELTATALDRRTAQGEVHVHGYGSPLAWRNDQELCFLADDHGRVQARAAGDIQNGKPARWTTLTPGDTAVQAFSLTEKHAAYVAATPTRYSDLYAQEGTGPVRPLPTLNPQVEKWQLPTLKVVRWKGHGDVEVEGILELPPGHKEGIRHPLVVCIHGGPTTCAPLALGWSINGNTYIAGKGYAVLHPNYRGSTGYGDAFLLGLNGKENLADVGDILAGADAMIEQGIADPQRMAVMGWSNGGYLTNCAITKTTRFKAAISGAGIIDHMMEWGLADEPAYPMVFKQGKTPWEARDAYLAASPVWSLGTVKTPTLIHVGGSDERCPPGHSRYLYRALRDHLNVPAELIVYPGEPHGLQKGSNRRAKMAWDLAWLEKWLR